MLPQVEARRNPTATPGVLGRMLVGVDFDGTVVTSRHDDPIRAPIENLLRWPIRTIDGADQGIRHLRAQSDIDFGGIVTSRGEAWRPQTRGQVAAIAPGAPITFTELSYKGKLTTLLDEAERTNTDNPGQIARVVLIDNRPTAIVAAAVSLAADRHYAGLMSEYGLTLVSFGGSRIRNRDKIPQGLSVVEMPDWSEPSLNETLTRLRAA